MTRYRCRYLGTNLPEFADWFTSDTDLSGLGYQCTRFADTENPPQLPRMIYADPSQADYGDSPSGPNAPVITTSAGDTTDRDAISAATPKKNKSAKGSDCCPDGEANCWLCWLKDNWMMLALLILSVAAFFTRKK